MPYLSSLLIFSCLVFAKDSPIIKTIPLDRRAADFGTEVITASIYGTASTFTHTALASITTNYAYDVQVQLADPLVSAISSLASNNAICTGKPALKRRSFLSSLGKRNPPTRTNRLVLDDCTTRRVNSIIDQMRPGGAFSGVIGLVRVGNVINQGLDGGIAGSMEAFYLRAQAIAELAWVPQELLRNAVDTVVEMVYEIQDDPQAIALFIYSNCLFGLDTRRSSRCDVDEKAPLCYDITCWGDDKLRCTRDPIKGCKCIRIMDIVVDGFDDTTWVDYQQNFLNGLGLPEGPPSAGPSPACNGDASVHWTTQDAVTKAVDLFCGDPNNLKGNPGQVNAQEYNKGTADDVILTIAMPADLQGPYVMSSGACLNYFKLIINECDNNDPQNPDNLQHGGAMITPSGLILTTDPQVGEAESKCYGLGTKTWVDATDLEDSQQQFCSSFGGHSKRSLAGSRVSNLGKYINSVTFRLDWPADSNIGPDECNKNFDMINAGCDGNDNAHNPLNFKHGGEVAVGGAKYVITPTVDRTNPPLLTYGWGWQKDAEVVSSGTTGINGAPIDKGDMQVCLDGLNNGAWHGVGHQVLCGSMNWDLGGFNSWNSANGCHMACVNSLSRAINNGANFAICDMWHKSAHCWEAFYNTDKDGLSSKKRDEL